MKRILSIFLIMASSLGRLAAQDTLYHVIDGYKEEPMVMEWNVSHQKAVSSKNYIIEVTDDSARTITLFFYYYGSNRRRIIDDPEIILFVYDDKSFDIYTNYSYETDCSMWADEDFRCLHYHVMYDRNNRMTDFSITSFVDTLRRKEYYQDMNVEENNGNLNDYIIEEYHGDEACKNIEIPFLCFVYSKNRIVPYVGIRPDE